MRVLVVTGASGGHIFPALSFLDRLKDKDRTVDILLVLPKRSIESRAISSYKVKYLSVSPIGLSLNLRNFIAIFGFLKGALESLILLLQFRPDIVVGFGSLNSLPPVLLAWVFRIRTVIHEQNVVPGRANRLLSKFSDRIAISFTKTRDYLDISQKRIVLTGNPLRPQLRKIEESEALGFFGFDDGKFTILVMGGSQGSQRINSVFLEAVSLLPDKPGFQVIHITGNEDYETLRESYKGLDSKIKLFTFLEDMQYAYSICDLVVCRAGASTIAELMFFRAPAIIVPYPFAYKHQLNNARLLESKGCAIVIKDNELDADILRQVLDELMHNPDKVKFMHAQYNDAPGANASDLLVDEVLSSS